MQTVSSFGSLGHLHELRSFLALHSVNSSILYWTRVLLQRLSVLEHNDHPHSTASKKFQTGDSSISTIS